LEVKETTYESKSVFIVTNEKKLKACPKDQCNCPCACKKGKKKGGKSSGSGSDEKKDKKGKKKGSKSKSGSKSKGKKEKGCPPGLAKSGCKPPGQAKKEN